MNASCVRVHQNCVAGQHEAYCDTRIVGLFRMQHTYRAGITHAARQGGGHRGLKGHQIVVRRSVGDQGAVIPVETNNQEQRSVAQLIFTSSTTKKSRNIRCSRTR